MGFWKRIKSMFGRKDEAPESPSFTSPVPADTSADREYSDMCDMAKPAEEKPVSMPVVENPDAIVTIIPDLTEEDGQPPVIVEPKEPEPEPEPEPQKPVMLGAGQHRFFTIEELCASRTAMLRNINNNPPELVRRHLHMLIEQLLDPIRLAWGSPIRVTSGYRCAQLNSAVGGMKTSAHKYGWAADLQPANGKQAEFEHFIRNYILASDIRYDQIIIERSRSSRWVHVGLYNASGQQRMQLFNIMRYGAAPETEIQSNETEIQNDDTEWPL